MFKANDMILKSLLGIFSSLKQILSHQLIIIPSVKVISKIHNPGQI